MAAGGADLGREQLEQLMVTALKDSVGVLAVGSGSAQADSACNQINNTLSQIKKLADHRAVEDVIRSVNDGGMSL